MQLNNNRTCLNDHLNVCINNFISSDFQNKLNSRSHLLYVIDGNKVLHSPGACEQLTRGKCLFIKKGTQIQEEVSKSEFLHITFSFSDEFLTDASAHHLLRDASFKNEKSDSVFLPINVDDSLEAYFRSMMAYCSGNNHVNDSIIELKFQELILNLITNNENQQIKNYLFTLHTHKVRENLKKVMEEKFFYNISLKEFAEISGRSLSTFKRDFKSVFGNTPGKWLLNKRILYSEILLKTSDKSVSEIAFDSGFENVSHFCRMFKKQFNSSPTDYRRSVMEFVLE